MDLFAGPGRYKDGSASTPLKVLELAIGDASLREMLVTHLDDANSDHSGTLEAEIARILNVDKLRHKPMVLFELCSFFAMSGFSKLG